MNVIELEDVSKSFGKGETRTEVLHQINLAVTDGEFVAIMGPSGSGKSTLMNIIGLLDTPSSGQYLLDNEPVSKHKDSTLARLRREKIGFVFQTFNLLPRLSLAQNVELPMIYHGLEAAHRHNRAAELLKSVGLGKRLRYRPNQISGGEIQRAAIARALANRPSLILADEPTGNLDSKSSDLVMELLKKLHGQGATIIVITHNPDVAGYAERVVHLKDGRLTTGGRRPSVRGSAK